MTRSTHPSSRPQWPLIIFGIILAIIGLMLTVGGTQLIWLDGSWYYALAGIGILLSAILFIRRKSAGAWLYGLVFLATLVWAYGEVGLNFWQLIPRVVAPTVLALLVLLLYPLFNSARSGMKIAYPVAAVLVAALVGTGIAAFSPQGVVRATSPSTPVSPLASEDMDPDWSAYGRTPAGTRFAPFDQINKENVNQLEVAWTFRTGDVPTNGAEDQNTPLQVGDTVYVCTAHNIVFALNAETGAERWKFDPQAKAPVWQRCRGVSYYREAILSPDACSERIMLTTIDARLIALDAKTGQQCSQFGNNGTVDLSQGMGEIKPGYYFQTSAPTIMRDLVLIGGWVFDNRDVDEPSGAVRAFSALTGELVWAWDLGNPEITKLPPEGESYTRSTPNVWSTPSFDDELGLIYLPTGNSPPDFWGAHRTKAAEDYTASVVALDIETGRERWKFQTVHHDLWDYDVPSQPALYDIPDGKGGVVPALVQVTKRGQIFLLDRRTGEPLAPVEEKPVPQGAQEGDWTSPTQPYSVGMPSIGNEPFTEASMWGATPLDQLYCRIEFKKMHYEGEFTPIRAGQRSLIFPGYYGGMNWGSASINEDNGYLIVNDIRMPQWATLLPREEADKETASSAHDGFAPQTGTPFGVSKNGFMSPLGVPCHAPPYGTISAIDLKSRQLVWQVPAGSIEDAGPMNKPTGLHIPIGMPTLGGPMSTASGLVFHAGTQDFYLRAFDVDTGDELWRGRLPVGAQATPMTYVSPESQRQFVVISAGGARQSPVRGDYIIAYSLPKKQ